ncbi:MULTISPECIES: hypothetical protein [Citrobacter freundii complex]|uniref:hypothetical protein n=1 Tax=Citrobacter freundii complex TaxID=1344959 RepID=UPI0012C39541|nr:MULTISPECIES: hypothetical protein [Citrobacter freundii complex]ECB1512536.1 hypothetical protein [Salmonella enterica subsp. enterica serovar Angoda]MBA7999507.1 hypothetical protein [Citrobacter freundii]MBJ8967662.1 hypothetical protein [Citrobacter freundii]MDV1635539.1 hypothetical protein [Citrobacter freundii]MDV1715068.1 hypothetical protein [Citrobacter freundii]
MKTNNHPANGPVSLDRLHQISEILSKAAAQSDGGNLGYAMADAVKVIDGAIAVFGAEPVLYAAEETLAYAKMGELHLKCLSQPMGDAVIPLYVHRQATDEIGSWNNHMNTPTAQAGNSPVTQDGYVLVPKKLTAENGAKRVLSGEFSETKFINCPECFGDDDCETCDGSGRIEITVPVSWTNIKAIWAKGVEHFAAAPQQENV